MSPRDHLVPSALLLAAALSACRPNPESMLSPDLHAGLPGPTGPAPSPLVGVSTGTSVLEIFPYLADDLSSAGRDPVNLVFLGDADPRSIRAALLGLDGNRSGTPLAGFDCTWSDAVGGLQTAWSAATGWVGGAAQLECGDYGPIRFHLRLFRVGEQTLGGAHFEFLIPGTSDHQVVSWELAEQLVTFDLARAGHLGAAPGSTGALNASPWFRTIPGFLHTLAAQADPQVAALLGQLGLVNLTNGDKGIPTDGAATVLSLIGMPSPQPGTAVQNFEVQFHQVIPKPFCTEGAPSPWVYATGRVHLSLTSTQRSNGTFDQEMRARGRLTLTPVDPTTGMPAGPPYEAEVTEFQQSAINQDGGSVHGMQHQLELPMGQPGRGQLQIKLKVGPSGTPQYQRTVTCGGQ